MSEHYSEVVKSLATVLKKLPSEFREDYPKSVPSYVIRRITSFNNSYKTEIGNIKNKFKQLCEENNRLQQELRDKTEALKFTNDVAPPMYEYNEVEFKMVLRAREVLTKWQRDEK